MRVYLDACTIIYAHEGSQDLRDKIAVWLDKAVIGGVVMTSSLSRLECRVKPLRDNDMGLLALYDGFFSRRSLLKLPIDDAVLDHAAAMRVAYRIRTPDAIHLASAKLAAADVFLTGDVDLQRCTDVNVVLIS